MTIEYKKGIFKIEEDEAVEGHTNTTPYRIGYMVLDRFCTMPIWLTKEELTTIRDLITAALETPTVKEPKNMTRNSKLLADFTQYCIDHPNERFWQALRNWSYADFIHFVRKGSTWDTFYWEDKNKEE